MSASPPSIRLSFLLDDDRHLHPCNILYYTLPEDGFLLLSLFERLLVPDGLLLLTDPLRPPAFEFADRLEKEGWHLKMESRFVEWEEERKEIAIFYARRRGPTR